MHSSSVIYSCLSFFNRFFLSCGQFPSDKHLYTEIDIKLRNKIKELDIRCRFYKYGCLKIDKVDNIEKHDSNCEYAKMVCEHLKNNSSSEFHSYNCPHTLTVCPACKKTIKLEEVYFLF